MYKSWKPLGKNLEFFPGIEVKLDCRNIAIVISYWRSGHCFYAFEISFINALAGIKVVDESNFLYHSKDWPKNSDFEKAEDSPIWVEKNSDRINLYNDTDPELKLYNEIDSYYFSGQNVVVVLDVESKKPRIKEIDPKSLND
ncbi:hypothetical protein OS175_14980 [Marinicella sp. S1101]|uniref:hypothetical protein n=1 Tax=Marinicella marina TaxID=2996016 RepID=UPI002260C921|nr:hypothetical protein [Marinicella marina]MCX7555179.1 hypothetical protein [Marinicella marina]MDJ1140005.1 hypothetical protein [Marinicella marina]